MLSVALLAGLWAAPAALARRNHRSGGIMHVALAGDPPSLDMHQNPPLLVAQPLGPVYNNLVVL